MPETFVEKAVCEACGKKVRDGSAFCFNCGESVIPEPPPPPIIRPPAGTLNGRKRKKGAKTAELFEPELAPIVMPEGKPVMEEPAKTDEIVSVPAPDPEPVVAASPTRVDRPNQRRTRLTKKVLEPVEVEWVENSGSSVLYIVGSVILAILAVLLVMAAMYLR